MTAIVTCFDLKVWQKAMKLALDVERITEEFPARERFGLSSRMRRAGVSAPSTISEGHARDSRGHFASHLSFAWGSVAKLEKQLELSTQLGSMRREAGARLLNTGGEPGKMLPGLKNGLLRRAGSLARGRPRRKDLRKLPYRIAQHKPVCVPAPCINSTSSTTNHFSGGTSCR